MFNFPVGKFFIVFIHGVAFLREIESFKNLLGKENMFSLVRYRNQFFSLVLHSCCSFRAHVALVLLMSYLYCTGVDRVALVLHLCRSCCSCLALVLQKRLIIS